SRRRRCESAPQAAKAASRAGVRRRAHPLPWRQSTGALHVGSGHRASRASPLERLRSSASCRSPASYTPTPWSDNLTSGETIEQALHVLELVTVPRVSHPWIQHVGDLRPVCAQDVGRLEDAGGGNVVVDVAAAEKDRRPIDRAIPRPRGSGRPDEAAAQRAYATVAGRIAHDELQRQTGALREAHQE